MHTKVRNAREELEAAIFSGAEFYDAYERQMFQAQLKRWQKELDTIANERMPDYEEERE